MVGIDEWEVARAVDDAIRLGQKCNVMVCNGCNALHNIT